MSTGGIIVKLATHQNYWSNETYTSDIYCAYSTTFHHWSNDSLWQSVKCADCKAYIHWNDTGQGQDVPYQTKKLKWGKVFEWDRDESDVLQRWLYWPVLWPLTREKKKQKVDLCTTNSLAIAILEDANVYTKTGHHSRDYSEKLFVKMRVGLLWQNRS